jgi:hypothetical protein
MGLDEGSGVPAQAAAPDAGGGMQFDRVELATPDAGRACRSCQKLIANEYYELGGNVVCPACAEGLRGGKGGGGVFLRASLLGGGAALLGTIVWFIIIKAMDAEYGLVAIAVGLFVGFAVRKGSGRRGGWKYQTLAMLLTYFSITASKVPFVLQGLAEGAHKAADARGKTEGKTGDEAGRAGDGTTAAASPAAGQADAHAAGGGDGGAGVGALLLAFAIILGIALASPFIGGTGNIMGIIILGIALYEAWKINKRLPITGPFRLAPRAAP